MSSIGFDQTELLWVWTLCAAILKVGNVDLGKEADGEAKVVDPAVVVEIAAMLRIDRTNLTNALTTRRIKAGSEWVTSPVNASTAVNVRDGLAKAMYQRVFSWMVMRINANLANMQLDDGLTRARFFIGILDIFGFEIFDENSLEQASCPASTSVVERLAILQKRCRNSHPQVTQLIALCTVAR